MPIAVSPRAAALIGALEALESAQAFLDAATPGEGYTRLAAAIAAVLLDRQTAIAPQDRLRLVLYATLTANVFAASAKRIMGGATKN